MKYTTLSLILITSALFAPVAFGYGSGGGGGGSSCSEPQFTSESPKNESTVASLSQFSGVKQDFKASRLNSGDSRIEVGLKQAKTAASKVRITVRAKSDEGCEAFQPFYIEVKP